MAAKKKKEETVAEETKAVKEPEYEPVQESDESRDKRQNRMFAYAVFIVLFVIAGFVFGPQLIPEKRAPTLEERFIDVLIGNEDETQFTYNDFAFVQYDNLWYSKIMAKDGFKMFR